MKTNEGEQVELEVNEEVNEEEKVEESIVQEVKDAVIPQEPSNTETTQTSDATDDSTDQEDRSSLDVTEVSKGTWLFSLISWSYRADLPELPSEQTEHNQSTTLIEAEDDGDQSKNLVSIRDC